MWTMAQGGLPTGWRRTSPACPSDEGPLAFWLGALCIKLFGWLLGDAMAARVSTIGLLRAGHGLSVWYTAFHLGRRPRRSRCGWPSADSPSRTTTAAPWPTPRC
jgi:hypothetical protein